MIGQVYDKYRHNDPLNVTHQRNVRNAHKYHYNCAGYALECFSWYCPNAADDTRAYGFYTVEEATRKTDKAVSVMLNDFPTMRVIKSVDEARKDEYVIAFRLSRQGDFHYVKRNGNNHWYHKMGGSPEIRTMTVKKVFSNGWDCSMFENYDGPLVLFAKKIEKGA